MNPILQGYWNKPVSELATYKPKEPFSPGLKERHRLYSLGLMAITHHYWNGLKKGRGGNYPWNPDPKLGKHMADDYRGHNIAGYAVDMRGEIIDFEFNHNKLMNSSVEHAESRLVRRIYSMTQINNSWDVESAADKAADDYSTFAEVTVYTTLESCSQCSGIMALARVRDVVYLQTDPGMYMIGNILRNLTEGTSLDAPVPVSSREFDLEYFSELDSQYDAFAKEVKNKPFFIANDGKQDTGPSITSFLCTQLAYDIYARAAQELEAYSKDEKQLAHPDSLPRPDRDGKPIPNGMTNQQVLSEVLSFRDYAINKGRRGTPHRT